MEWLTTGQMIDRLKVGEVAECMESKIPSWVGMKVEHKGFHFRVSDDKGSEEFFLSNSMQMCKWQIIPAYVSFEEAKEALNENKKAVCYWNGWKHIYSKNEYGAFTCEIEGHGKQKDNRATWEEIYCGKWTIEE